LLTLIDWRDHFAVAANKVTSTAWTRDVAVDVVWTNGIVLRICDGEKAGEKKQQP